MNVAITIRIRTHLYMKTNQLKLEFGLYKVDFV